eukprot:CAMPEP_0168609204 /NCGR_PEP_ID=MMETSP0449_2-20121227/1073_1 /TAXON_ID=1082188 /ORGANISM="Strombidium rassoulzadegani, Strain ras09" /LENGTH=111 /DNA_ID=CAMNT_0008649315 /DNA_START=924 /DNA_END=1256 /DNA_ORIENTATION=+
MGFEIYNSYAFMFDLATRKVLFYSHNESENNLLVEYDNKVYKPLPSFLDTYRAPADILESTPNYQKGVPDSIDSSGSQLDEAESMDLSLSVFLQILIWLVPSSLGVLYEEY